MPPEHGLLTQTHVAPPEEDQPHPSQDLLEGHFKGETELAGLPDVNHKVSGRDGGK